MRFVRAVPVLMMAAVTGWSVPAQQPMSATGKGSVTGHVTYGDTQRPARLAAVVLLAVPAKVTMAPKVDPTSSLEAQMAIGLKSLASFGDTTMLQAGTGPDGSFTVTDAPPGDYYAFAAASGYVSPIAQVEDLLAGGADMSKPLPGVPVVHVTADRGSNVDLTLQRGAAISGTVRWDDGSPISGATLAVTPPTGDDPRPPQQFSMLAMANVLGSLAISDDLGHYRISGLAPGQYVVKATVKTSQGMTLGRGASLTKMMMAPTPLVVFSPSAFHKPDAKAVSLHAGDDVRDNDVVLNLGGLHSVSGRVVSMETRSGINQANVKLVDTADKTFMRTGGVDAGGNFTVTYVPAGTYNLLVQDAEDTEPAKPDPKSKPKLFAEDKTLRSYADGTATVLVTDRDVAGQVVELHVKSKAEQEADEKSFNNSLGDLTK